MAKAEIDSRIKVFEATENAEGFLKQVEADVASLQAKLIVESASYKQLASQMGMNTYQLLQFAFIDALEDYKGGEVIMGVQKPGDLDKLTNTKREIHSPTIYVNRTLTDAGAWGCKSGSNCMVGFDITSCTIAVESVEVNCNMLPSGACEFIAQSNSGLDKWHEAASNACPGGNYCDCTFKDSAKSMTCVNGTSSFTCSSGMRWSDTC